MTSHRRNQTRRRVALAAVIAVGTALGSAADVAAQPSPAPAGDEPQPSESAEAEAPEPPVDPNVAKARELFKVGVTGVRKAQWSEALASFEKSAALRPHATTTFNIGACERAMGRYTAARATFLRSLEESRRRPGELAERLALEAKGFVSEIDGVLARIEMRVVPAGATVTMDGRPPRPGAGPKGEPVFVAGVEAPGPGLPAPIDTFVVLANPGAHVVTLRRKGYTDAVVHRTVAPGSTTKLDLRLDRLPATLAVSSNVDGAIVSVDGKDFGPAPVSVLRPAGSYRVSVNKAGFEPYEAQVDVQAGEEAALEATLLEEHVPITKEWWFWAGAAAVVAGGAFATWALTRPDPEPPPYEGGNTGWVVFPSGVSF